MTDNRKPETGKFCPKHNNVDIQSQLKLPLMAIHNYVEVGRSLVKQGYTHEQTLADLFDKMAEQVSCCYELNEKLQHMAKSLDQYEKGKGKRRDQSKPVSPQ